jgi:hypothetical protein
MLLTHATQRHTGLAAKSSHMEFFNLSLLAIPAILAIL